MIRPSLLQFAVETFSVEIELREKLGMPPMTTGEFLREAARRYNRLEAEFERMGGFCARCSRPIRYPGPLCMFCELVTQTPPMQMPSKA